MQDRRKYLLLYFVRLPFAILRSFFLLDIKKPCFVKAPPKIYTHPKLYSYQWYIKLETGESKLCPTVYKCENSNLMFIVSMQY